MALFKQMRGKRADLDKQPLHDGYAYFCTDDGSFHIDYTDDDGNVCRKQINADEANFIKNKPTISGTVTKEIGGIAKNKVYTNAELSDVLSDLLFPYVAFSFSSISTEASAGTQEYGTSVTISKVKPSFTAGSKTINSVKIGTTSGGSDLYSGTSATNNTAITLTTSKTYGGTTGGTVYCTLSDGTTTTTKSAAVSYAYYTYYAVTNTADAPSNWTAVGSTSVSGIEITATAGQYIWIATTQDFDVTSNSDPKQQYGICQLNELSGKYNNAANTIKITNQTLVNSQNHTCSGVYRFYRLEASRAADTKAKFKLGKGD